MAIISKFELEQYQYGVHVQKGRQLYMMSEKKIYFGQWLNGNRQEIIIIEMSKQIAEREAPFYLAVNGHENIIRTFGSVVNPSNLTIYVQEYAPQGDLADCLMDNQLQFTQPMLVQIFTQIADAMSYVASKKIVHGDLGCRNILVVRVDPSQPKNNFVKLTDFGLARWIEHPPTNEDTTVVPIRYCAPEILRHNRHASYSEKTDVYSFGVLIWEALSNSEIPYSSIAKDEDVKQKKLNNERLPQPQVCDRQLWILMNDCWHKKPHQRPTFEEINDRFIDLAISEVPHDLITASSHKVHIHCDYELDIDVKIKSQLNDGHPSIYEAQWKTGDEKRAIIVIEKNEEPSEHEKLFYTTFKNHPHIVHTFGFVENDRGSIMILQERAPHGNLQSLLETGQFEPSAKVLVEIFSQIINAMIDIASQGLVHGDLCCKNILIFQMHPSDPKRNLVKLSNFTLAHPNDASYTDERRVFVPVRYCALEILRSAGRSNYSELSDVYSLGVLMWQAYSGGKLPYNSSETNGEVRQRKLNGEKLPRILICAEKVWSIMEDCWHNELQLRYIFEDMKTRFSHLNPQEIEPYQYELNKNVKQNRLLDVKNGRFYEADWIPKKDQPILLYVIDGPTAEDEARLNIKFNSHPHILHTYGLVKNDDESIMLLQERALYGNLQALLQSENFKPSSNVLVAIFLQIVDAMIYISRQNIVHGDLRCANILVFQMDSSEPTECLVKLTNFSLARTKNQPLANNRLPDSYVRYCAPEILRNEDGSAYTELSDVYSMGALMYEACSKGEAPYGRRTSDRDVRQQRLNNTELEQPKECHNQIWSVIEDCCRNERSRRLTFEELNIRLSKIDIKIYRLVPCYTCKEDFPENEIEKHRQSCITPISPIDYAEQIKPFVFNDHNATVVRVRPVNSDSPEPKRSPSLRHVRSQSANSYVVSTRSNSPDESDRTSVIDVSKKSARIRRNSDVSSVKSIQYRSCKHCTKLHREDSIEAHEKSYCRKRFQSSVIEPEPEPSSTRCANCSLRFPSDEIANHQRTCKPTSLIITEQPRFENVNPMEHNNRQRPVLPVNPPKVPSPSEPKSCWARLCSCLSS